MTQSIIEIRELLIKAGFSKEPSEPGMYYNDYVSVNIDYQKKGEIIIVNAIGNIVGQLPTNYYAILGWLLKKRLVSFMFLDSLN